MKVIDLFSGIGGFSLGLESTGGFETVQFVEYDKWCQKILAKNFPGVPITGDIKDYEPKRSERIGLVCGGFPCQPFSVAGKRKGTEDDRHLWPEMLRVIKASKPRFVIGENVRNLTSIQDGLVFEQVCVDLENEGYEVQSFIIPASAVEAPHQRYRVWIVAYSDIRESRSADESESRKEKQFKSCTNSTSQRGNVENTYNNGQQRGLFETRYQTFTGQRSKVIRRNGANMFGGSSNDGRNYKESTVDGAIQRSCNGNKTESTEPRSVCGVSEESNNDKNTLGENRHQENHDRTLVQEGQNRVQSSLNQGLGEDKTIFERNKIQSGDDTDSRDRVETTTNVAHSESNKQDGIPRETKSEHDKGNSWVESKCRSNRQSVGETKQDVANTEVSDRYAHETNSEHGESKAQEIPGNRSSLSGESSEQSLELGLGGMVDGLSKRLDRHEGFDREPNISRVATGQKDRVNRLKGLGNAIVPQIAYQIGLAILQAESDKFEE